MANKDHRPLVKIVEDFLNEKFSFRRNVVTQRVEYKPFIAPDSEYKKVNIDTVFRRILHKEFDLNLTELRSLLNSDFVEDYDPFVDYFTKLPAWDGIDHISALADHVKTDDQDFFITQFKKALVRSIACTLPPHKENRIVFVFVQEKQSTGKSTFLRFLNPFGDKYYTEAPLRDNKDTEFRFAENFIYNMEELSSLSNTDVNKLKAMISKAVIKERKPYAVDEEEHPRRCNFWGSTNKPEFLTDIENTRWLPFNVIHINWGYKETIDIKKVWAQAYHLFNTGFDYQLTKEEASHRDEKNKMYEVLSNEYELAQQFFTPCTKDEKGGSFYSVTEISSMIMDVMKNKYKINHTGLSNSLKKLGFVYDRKRVKGAVKRGYYLKTTSQWVEEKTGKAVDVLSESLTELAEENKLKLERKPQLIKQGVLFNADPVVLTDFTPSIKEVKEEQPPIVPSVISGKNTSPTQKEPDIFDLGHAKKDWDNLLDNL